MKDKNEKEPLGGTGSVTADNVAELAGVSRWTVNRAFRDNASISEASRKKVLDAAEALGYVPDLLAASLASERSNLVALLVDDFSNPHKLVMMECVTRALRLNGWDTLLVNMTDPDDASRALLNASQRRVDAAVLIGVNFNDEILTAALGAKRIKKLIIFARESQNPDTISICCDDKVAMGEIAEYVVEKGYRRPMFLAGPETYSAHLWRKETFADFWQARFGEKPKLIAVPVYDPELAFNQVANVLTGREKNALPDIIVCENDALAIGAMDAIRHNLGLKVPDDIAVIGFDDVPMANNPNYRLTTYRQPLADMADCLVSILKGEDASSTRRDFKGQLIARKSA